MFKFSKSALLGFVVAMSCIIISMAMSGEMRYFLNWASVFITVGGTTGSVIIAYPPKRLKTLGPVMKKSFNKEEYDLRKDIDTIVTISEVVRRQGLLEMEDSISKYTDDEFLIKGITLLVDGADGDMIKSTLETEMYCTQQRHKQGYGLLEMIAATAPALGLLGTYVGLIPMLQNIDDPNKLGPLMALELVTTFYGAFVAYVVFSPMAKRLKTMSMEELVRKEFLLEGILAIRDGHNPRIIRENLMSYLTKSEIKSMAAYKPMLTGKPESEESADTDASKVVSFGKGR